MVLAVRSRSQCDQMARLFFQYLAIDKFENLPKSMRLAKVG